MGKSTETAMTSEQHMQATQEVIQIASEYLKQIVPDFGEPVVEEISMERIPSPEGNPPETGWSITFSKKPPAAAPQSLEQLLLATSPRKVVQVRAKDKTVISIRNKTA